MKHITEKNLDDFRIKLLDEFKNILSHEMAKNQKPEIYWDWMRSKDVRGMLKISPSTLQNLRISGKIRYKKIMGIYYYSKDDINRLFKL